MVSDGCQMGVRHPSGTHLTPSMNREKIVDVLVEHAIIDRRVVPGSRNR